MKTSKLFLAFVCLTFITTAAFADSAKGGLRYSITVTKFENSAGWHGRWDIGDAWGTVLTDLLWGTGRRQGMVEAMAKQAARTVGSQVGRQILRGVLGGILGGSRRR